MKILDKTILSKVPPTQTNVLWADTNTSKLKIYRNGKWETLSTEEDPNIAEWARAATPPSLESLNAVGEEYSGIEGLLPPGIDAEGYVTSISWANSAIPTGGQNLSAAELDFISHVNDKVENKNIESLKLKSILLREEEVIIPLSITVNNISYTIEETSVQTVTWDIVAVHGVPSSAYIAYDKIISIHYLSTNGVPQAITEDLYAPVKVVNNGTSNKGTGLSPYEIKPNTYYVWGEVDALNLTLATPDNDSILNEYTFEFTSGSNATLLNLPGTVKFPDGSTPEANKKYQVSIVNNIGLIVGVATS